MDKHIKYRLNQKAGKINWELLLLLIMVLNVKLPVKVAALVIYTLMHWKTFSFKDFFRQRYLVFYFGVTGIGLLNLLIQIKNLHTAYLVTAALGIAFWMCCAIAAYHLYNIVKKDDAAWVHNTLALFFILHFTVVFVNLLLIMVETGSLNPYTYKGLNQKYYISTGDFITGISFDSSVTTAFICAAGLLYFFYRRQFILSLLAMAALLIMGSNLTNLLLVGILLYVFIFSSDRVQKSFIIIYGCMLIVFMAKISPQNSEHVGRIAYQVAKKPYDLPPVKVIPLNELKKMPDSLLTVEERKKKLAQNYIDSMSALSYAANNTARVKGLSSLVTENKKAADSPAARVKEFYVYHESITNIEKISNYDHFLNRMYSVAEKDSLKKLYDWKKPGKWIAGQQLFDFLKDHPGKMVLGTGIGNFSSRVAFKVTALGIAGRYPAGFQYVSPWFLKNHLYLYLYYHSQDQSQHAAANTPDSVYYQLAGEYGIAGLFLLIFFYFGFFIRRIPKKSFGLPLLLLLAGAFFVEYWFEQLSIVILFELLLFLDIKSLRQEEQAP